MKISGFKDSKTCGNVGKRFLTSRFHYTTIYVNVDVNYPQFCSRLSHNFTRLKRYHYRASKPAMSATMKDVAQRAGVSIKTVSRVVNGQGGTSEETRERIQNIIDEMGFRPNMMARGLVIQRTHSIALIVPSLSNPFYPEIAEAVQSTARKHHYHVMLCSHENQATAQQNILASLKAQGVDGIIIFPALNSIEQLSRFADRSSPMVVVNEVIKHAHIGLVQADIVQGAHQAVDYLVQRGHTQIGIMIPKNWTTC